MIWANDYQSLIELCSSGQSGSLFYYTEDQHYLIKTIHEAEFRKLKLMLPGYYEHILEHPESLINRIYGMHQIKWKYNGVKIKKFLVVMNNLF